MTDCIWILMISVPVPLEEWVIEHFIKPSGCGPAAREKSAATNIEAMAIACRKERSGGADGADHS